MKLVLRHLIVILYAKSQAKDGFKYVLLGSMDDIYSQKFNSLGNHLQESLTSTLERVKTTNIGLNMDKDVAKQKSDRVIPSDRQLDPKDLT
ncbi:hypothetical protein E3Q10_00052 [Wallemia mellicola]|uniref:Uncharacterized protein n=1 Tax=Wallemia mellicola TaxID=1708541 RepID=A0A4T0RH72_9BASI|nr:hypothetical protein E3Q10_00052 [Wallemia mellicola]